MRSVFEELFLRGDRINPSKGPAAELAGVLLEITNPRARLSRTETRGRSISCLGELCWYLAKTNDLGFISYYIPEYRKSADGDVIFGGYGPRLFDWKGLNQLEKVTEVLRKKPNSRQAVIQLFDAHDITEEHRDIPCTCTLQFMIRRSCLHMFTNMRSNDAYLGLPHDVFCFSMLQEIMARDLSIELGTYKHAVGSLHLYDRNRKRAKRFLDEGWQSTEMSMPPMPIGNPWLAINSLVEMESNIRLRAVPDSSRLNGIDPYWADLIRLLQMFRYKKDREAEKIVALRARMSSGIYEPYIEGMLNQLRQTI
ncbi:MAG: thymidylate synthase [Ignavibacteriae bacterium]|nr:thymidylate synthase [Ignavibacteriota bacterium]